MGRILLLLFLGGLGAWAYASATSGPAALALSESTRQRPTRAYYAPIYVPPPPSNRTGSTSGPRVGGGGPSFGK